MTLEISAARMSIFSLSSKPCDGLSALHRLGEGVEFGADGAVDHLAADLDDETAEDGGIDDRVDGDVAAHAGAKVLLDGVHLTRIERVRRGNLGGDLAAVAGGEQVECADDVAELGEAAVASQHTKKVRGDGVELHRLRRRGDGFD